MAGCLFITVNLLFYFKYAYRISWEAGVCAALGYLLFVFLLYFLWRRGRLAFPRWLWFGALATLAVGAGALFHLIPKESLNVDRWEMIQLFWDSVAEGVYPYGAHSEEGNYPGPMPVYFILAYPFYKIGEIGWMAVVGVALFLVFYARRLELNDLGVLMALVFSSVAIYWEIFARSTIWINALLFFLYLYSLRRLPRSSGLWFYGMAALGGALLSTRTVFILPLMVWGIHVLRRKAISLARLIRWGICFLGAFALTFLPFYLMDPHTFTRLNPFITQGDVLLPFAWVLAFVGLTFFLAFLARREREVYFYGGLSLFMVITGHVAYGLYDNGIASFLTDGADISYYLFCFPFLLETIVNKDEYDTRQSGDGGDARL